MFFALLLLWLLLSGNAAPSTLLSGAVVSFLITLFCRKFMGYKPKIFRAGLKKGGAIARYLLFLLKEILLANIAVVKCIYRSVPVEPVLVRFKTTLKSEASKVLVANSITLTPGTYTVHLAGDEYCVHALDRSFAVGLEACAFLEKAKKLEE